MQKSTFHNENFEINGIQIPEFELKSGSLIRIYIPNFNNENKPLGFDLTIELIKRFQNQKTNLPWAKNHQQNFFSSFLNPLTVHRYLINTMKIDKVNSEVIIDELKLNPNEKYEHLSFNNKKTLAIKAHFKKNDSILLDYYGVSASEIEILEKIVNTEINKGKSAIVFDNLQFAHEKEPYKNIKPIKITLPTSD
ncbi:hypothetical protein LNP04_17865 [Chryseobacterium sp. C-71]|uniref:hypothetical protein n=1 Tax=Chryseobacterium sp. C-71 TaxID=2893882 RepID=UPI001E33F0E4|nr:hypothetical protein [Chryseobacterium sp. C-71]UFH31809.1 hypothetical protein LNP04_17865 [Chryseobacterium sp. C-71]